MDVATNTPLPVMKLHLEPPSLKLLEKALAKKLIMADST